MKKIMTVIRKEYLERVRSKSFVIGTLLGPALMSMFIVLPMLLADSGGEDERTIGVIDPSGLYFDRLSSVLEERGHESLTVNRIEVGAGGPLAAVEQLTIWSERTGVDIVKQPAALPDAALPDAALTDAWSWKTRAGASTTWRSGATAETFIMPRPRFPHSRSRQNWAY